MLREQPVATLADTVALVALVECVAEVAALRAEIERHGSRTYETTTTTGGTLIRARPEIAMLADADRRLRGWLAVFGLSPADRSRVSAHPDKSIADDPYDGF